MSSLGEAMRTPPPAPGDLRTAGGRTLVVVATLLATIGMWAWPLEAYDAGIAPSAATFVLHGALPYRDFWFLYGPLAGYVVAIPTAILGPSLGLLRVMGMVIVVLQALLSLELVGGSLRGTGALVVVLAAAVVPLLATGPDPTAWSIAMLFATGALVVAQRTRSPGTALLAGAVAGVAFLARLDLGGYALLSCLILLRSPRPILGFAAVAGLPVLAALILVPWADLYEQLVWYPIVGPRLFRAYSLPVDLGSAASVIGLVESLSIRVGLAAVAVAKVVGRLADPRVTGLLVFAILCQLQTLGRGDLYHVSQASTPAILLFGVVAGEVRPAFRRVVFAFMLGGVGFASAMGLAWVSSPAIAYPGALADAVSYVKTATAPGEPIFVGLTENRYTYTNPLIAYYLADRPPATRYTMYNPGVTNTDEAQAAMVAQIGASGARYLLLDRDNAATSESGQGALPGSTILDAYIASHFVVARDFGSVVVMVRAGP